MPQERAPCLQQCLMLFLGRLEPQAWALQPLEQPTHITIPPPSGTDPQGDGQLGAEGGLTGKGDVEAPLPRGVIRLELEAGHMAAAGDGGGQLVS